MDSTRNVTGDTGARERARNDGSLPNAGLTTTPVITSFLDNVGSVQGEFTTGRVIAAKTDDTTPTLKGTAAPGAVVNIYEGIVNLLGTATADADGNWSFTPSQPFSKGLYNLSAGVGENVSDNFPLRIDPDSSEETPVPLPIVSTIDIALDNVGDKQGEVFNSGITDDTTPTLQGKGEPNTFVDVFDNGQHIGVASVDDRGSWTFDVFPALAQGEHVFTLGVAGVISEPFTLTVELSPAFKPSIQGAIDKLGLEQGEVPNGGITDDATPFLHGTGQPDSYIDIFDNGQAIGMARVDGRGNWSYNVIPALPLGEHVFTLGVGGVMSDPFTLIIEPPKLFRPLIEGAFDDVGPVQNNVVNGGVTDDATPFLHGRGEPGSRVNIFDKGQHVGVAQVDDRGIWSFQVFPSLSAGEHVFTLESGGVTSDPFTLVVDTAAVAQPSIEIVIDNVGSQQGLVPSGGTTDDSTPTLIGKGEPNTYISIYDNGNAIGSFRVDAQGNWSATLAKLPDGEHVFTVSGPNGTSTAFVLNIEAPEYIKPLIEAALDNVGNLKGDVFNGGITDDTTPTLRGKGEPGAYVNLFINGVSTGYYKADAAGNWTANLSRLPYGDYVFTVAPIGGAVSDPFTLTIAADAGPKPVIEVAVDNVGAQQGDVRSGGTTDDTTPTLRGKGEPYTSITVYDNGLRIGSAQVSGSGDWSFIAGTPALAAGEHAFTVVSGGVSSESFVLIVEPFQPTIEAAFDNAGTQQGDVINGGSTDDRTPTLRGVGTPNTQYTVFSDGKTIGLANADQNGNWSFNVPMLDGGEHVFTVVGGGISSASFTLTIEVPQPTKPVIESVYDNYRKEGDVANGGTTDDATPTLRGTGEPNTYVGVYINGNLQSHYRVDALGNWTATLPQLSEGNHVLTVGTLGGAVISDPYVVNIVPPLEFRPSLDSVGTEQGDVLEGGLTEDTTPLLQGRGEPGSRVSLFDNSWQIGVATVGADGRWSFSVTPALELGKHVFNVVINGLVSDPFVLNVEPTGLKPFIEAVYDDVGAQQGDLRNGGSTDDNTPTFSGKGEPNSWLNVYSNGKHAGTAQVDALGNWTVTLPKLTDGEHVFTVRAWNSVVASEPFVLNVQSPTIANPVIEAVSDNVGAKQGDVLNGGSTDDNSPTLRGTGEPDSYFSLYNNGVLIYNTRVDANGNWELTLPELPDGKYVFTVQAWDGTVISDPFELNIQAPVIDKPVIEAAVDKVGTEQGDVLNGGTTDDSAPTLRGTGEPNAYISIYNNGNLFSNVRADANGNWGATLPVLAVGEHVFTVKAWDSNVISAPFVLNVEAPVFGKPVIDVAFDNYGKQGDVVNGGTTDDATPILRGKGEPGASFTLYDNGNIVGHYRADAQGNWSITLPRLLLGEHAFTVVSNGVSSEPFTLTVEPSKVAIDSAIDDFGLRQGELLNGGTTDDTTPTLRGQGVPYAVLNVYADGVFVGQALVSREGNWTFKVPELGQGEHVFTLGKPSGALYAGSFTLTVTAPDASKPVVESVIDNIGGVSEIANGGTTDDARPTFFGKGAPNSTVLMYDNGEHVANIDVDAAGNWSYFDHYGKLSQGTHEFVFVNGGAASDPFVLVIADVPQTPKPTIDSVFDQAGTETGNVGSGASIDDLRPVFSGRGEPDSVVLIYQNGVMIDAAQVDAQGSWTFQPEAQFPLKPGAHVFTVITDNVTSEPFLLEVQGPAQGDALPSLSELLQSTAELFAIDVDWMPQNDAVLDLSGFNIEQALPEVGGVMTFAPTTTLTPLQQDALYLAS